MSAAEYLSWCANAPEAEWIAACRQSGHDPAIRPSHGSLRQYGRAVQGDVLAVDWAAHLARRKAQGRYLGE